MGESLGLGGAIGGVFDGKMLRYNVRNHRSNTGPPYDLNRSVKKGFNAYNLTFFD